MTKSPKYRLSLPQRAGGLFLTDGGIETTLIFQEGIDLPHFHPTHFQATLEQQPWTRRIGGIRANASRRSHEELNE